MSSSHRKRKRRPAQEEASEATAQASAPTPPRQTPPVSAEPTPPASAEPTPPIEVPVIGPPRRKPMRKPARDEGPALPPGALVSLTISGGFAFSQREVVVYDDGRMTTAGISAGRGQSQRSTHLHDDQMAAVRHELARLQPSAFSARPVRPSPDSYAYEIAARVGDKVTTTSVSTGFIPPELAPLLRLLRDLARED